MFQTQRTGEGENMKEKRSLTHFCFEGESKYMEKGQSYRRERRLTVE